MKKFILTASLIMTLVLSGCGGAATPAAGSTTNNAGAAGSGTPEASAAETNDSGNTSGTEESGGAVAASNPVDPASLSGNIKISVIGEDDRYLQSAIESFKAVYENAGVEMVTYGWNVEQYMKSISTAIMSGTGEDIIDTLYLTWQKMADREKLVDLNEYLTLDPADYYINVLDSYLYKGKRYTVPTSFNFRAYGLMDAYKDKEPAANINLESVIAMAEKYPGTKLFFTPNIHDGATLAGSVMDLNYADFIDIENRTADVDNERFISILNKIKPLNGRMAAKNNEDILFCEYEILSPDTAIWTDEYTVTPDGGISSSVTGGNINFTDFFLFTNEEGQGLFYNYGLLPAINANSGQRELAAEFIKHLISEGPQSSPEMFYTPVNKKAGAKKSAELLKELLENDTDEGGFDLEKNIEIFDGLVSRLGVVKNNDITINEFIEDEIRRFMEDQQTAEQAASNLQAKLNMYLNE